jgi:hypothetical protein
MVDVVDVDEWPFQRSAESATGALLIATVVAAGLALVVGGSADGINWHLFFGVLAAGSAALTYRYWKAELRAGPSGVVIRNPLRRREFSWDEVAKFEVAGSVGAGSGSAIGIVRRDGWRMTATAGSRLSDTEVAHDVEWLNNYLDAQRPLS